MVKICKKWEEEEDEVLRKNYQRCKDNKITKQELLDLLPGRTWYGITSRVRVIDIARSLPDGVLRKCLKCGLEAITLDELDLFILNPKNKYGRVNLCKDCVKKQSLERRKEKPFHYVYLIKKSHCKIDKMPFDLTGEYLENLWKKQNGKCALSALEMERPYFESDYDWVASLDRIDFTKGYVKGNVRWIINAINTLKRQKDDAFVFKIAKAIVVNQNL